MMEKRIIIWFIVAGLLGGVLLNGAAFAAGKHTGRPFWRSHGRAWDAS